MPKLSTDQAEPKINNTKLIDNRKENMGEYLKNLLKPNSVFKFVSAYFTIYGFQAMRAELNNPQQVKFLYGDMTNIKGLDPQEKEPKNYILTEESELIRAQDQLSLKYEALQCKKWFEKDSVEVKGIQESNLLHGKMYSVQHTNSSGDTKKDAIIGSSNFTKRGLGFGKGSNYELNIAVKEEECDQIEEWFDSLWENKVLAKDIKAEVIAELEKLGKDQSPEFIYFKTLYEIFKDRVEEQKQSDSFAKEIDFKGTKIYKDLYAFQKRAVDAILLKLSKHNGCILSDSVGLGKTYTALGIIRHYELRGKKVLVLCPKKIRNNWALYKQSAQRTDNPLEDDNFSYALLNHTDLSSRVDDDDNLKGKSGDIDLSNTKLDKYDLLVIDESHNFRNNKPGRTKVKSDPDRKKKSRYERLMNDIIKSGKNTQVLMLSATPVNNSLTDLRNQIYLISKGKDDHFAETLGINNIKTFFKNVQSKYIEWSELNPKKRDRLDKHLGGEFLNFMDEISISRSREHIKRYYDAKDVGEFPKRERPISREPLTDNKEEIKYEEIYEDIKEFKLSIYHPADYLKENSQSYQALEQGNLKQSIRERHLINMMRVNMLKRLESSVYSFTETIDRTIKKSDIILGDIKKFNKNQEQDTSSYKINDEFQEYGEQEGNEDIEEMTVGRSQTSPIKLKDLKLDEWQKDIELDRLALEKIYKKIKVILDEKRDAKIDELRSDIINKINNPTHDKNGKSCKKLLIFTAFADTANYLYRELNDEIKNMGVNVACVTGSDCKSNLETSDFNEILFRFSPDSKNRAGNKETGQRILRPEEEIDIMIATDCISEGQNLQDCDTVISYDIHWNPVRIIQRFGRVDRIGSRHKEIKMINYWPTKGLDIYINLHKRVTDKMALVDAAATGDDNPLTDDDQSRTADLFNNNIASSLKDLHDGSIDLDKVTEEEFSLQNFTLEDFRAQLLQYIANNEKELREAPNGLFAVTDTQPENSVDNNQESNRDKDVPGIIFCLKQKNLTEDKNKQGAGLKSNPLYPYILVYMKEDGTKFYGYQDAKDILISFGRIAVGKKSPKDELCNQFDTKTNNGTDMSSIEKILNNAQEQVQKTSKKGNRAALAFGAPRDAEMTPQEDLPQDNNYELITWLVIY